MRIYTWDDRRVRSDGARHPTRMESKRSAADETVVTVEQLLSLNLTSERCRLLAGAEGLRRSVESVNIGNLLDTALFATVPTNSLVLLDGRTAKADNYLVDIALRNAARAQASGLMVIGFRGTVSLGSVRLADKLKIPLLEDHEVDPLSVADAFRSVVVAPETFRVKRLLKFLDVVRPSTSRATLAQQIPVLESLVGGPVGVIAHDGTLIIGNDLACPSKCEDLRNVPLEVSDREFTWVTQPLALDGSAIPTMWLSARLCKPSAVVRVSVADQLMLLSWIVTVQLLQERLLRERDARLRLSILSSILDASDSGAESLLRDMASLGWLVDGWCSGIQIHLDGSTSLHRDPRHTEILSTYLERNGIHAPVIERPGGWSLWCVQDSEPTSADHRQLEARLKAALEQTVTSFDGLSLHAGIGSPRQGLAGLRQSLDEARQTVVVAQAQGGRFGVAHNDVMGARRILLGWYASKSFASYAESLLEPLTTEESGQELLRTLEIFLDQESSATDAASVLGVHRNTVINRVERIKALLASDLDDPEERLAAQLACRVLRIKAVTQGTESY
jgi:purine catabolism regulator